MNISNRFSILLFPEWRRVIFALIKKKKNSLSHFLCQEAQLSLVGMLLINVSKHLYECSNGLYKIITIYQTNNYT